jgi:hypothetical protein
LNNARGFHELLSARQLRCRVHGVHKIHVHVLVP